MFIRTTPSFFRYKDKAVTKKIFGVGVEFEDKTEKLLVFKKNMKIDFTQKVPTKKMVHKKD